MLCFFDKWQQVESQRSTIEEFNRGGVPEGLLQKRHRVYPHSFIRIQGVPDAENDMSAGPYHVLLSVTFKPVETLLTSFPFVSII